MNRLSSGGRTMRTAHTIPWQSTLAPWLGRRCCSIDVSSCGGTCTSFAQEAGPAGDLTPAASRRVLIAIAAGAWLADAVPHAVAAPPRAAAASAAPPAGEATAGPSGGRAADAAADFYASWPYAGPQDVLPYVYANAREVSRARGKCAVQPNHRLTRSPDVRTLTRTRRATRSPSWTPWTPLAITIPCIASAPKKAPYWRR